MSAKAVITQGFGSFGTIAEVVRDGYGEGASGGGSSVSTATPARRIFSVAIGRRVFTFTVSTPRRTVAA